MPRLAISCMPTQIPKEGPRLDAHRFGDRLDHAVDGIEPAPAIGEGADARQHQTVGAVGLIRIAGDEDLLRNLQAARGALECLGGGMQIA
ncbi:hypothetical protein ABIF97_002626 [Bradyrhizobium japonicum]